jgi:hypothetical protein
MRDASTTKSRDLSAARGFSYRATSVFKPLTIRGEKDDGDNFFGRSVGCGVS